MEQKLKSVLKSLKINEGLISSIMGGVVVVIMAAMIFNYFKSVNKNGKITDESASNASVTEETTPKELPATYKVKQGDDLWHISEKYYNSGYNYVDIAKTNKLANASAIEVGQDLVIPKVGAKKITVLKAEPETTVVANTPITKISIEGAKYTTVKGDHLWSIAVRAYGDGYAWTKIYNANRQIIGRNPSILFSGVELTLPR
ncbi:LysM peptidoglycan-binding domain-containing protein [Candidatus Collierbacteria bacterium]|nr:LysM peptidoglycan-binding domain-containing protein [Candidatus Collierbacteria bacterium]